MSRSIAIIGIFCLFALIAAGCTDAAWERQTALGNKHKVVMYSGGQQVGEWKSTGAPRSIADEDGWQFVDDNSKQFITVTGDVVITKLDE